MGIFDKAYTNNNKFIFGCTGFTYSFSKISGISNSMEVETINEGGYNDAPIFLVKQKTKPEVVVLEQGVRRGVSENVALRIGMPVYAGMIIVLNGIVPEKVYAFESGVITKYEVGELDALRKAVLIRKIEITHSGLYEV